VDIAKNLKISLLTVQSIHSGQRAQKVRKRTSKTDLKIKQAIQDMSKGGSTVSAKKYAISCPKKYRRPLPVGDYIQ